MGWNVVNVSYRLAGTAHARGRGRGLPLRVARLPQREQYNFDLDRIW